jgi:hypothetical protein
MISNDGEGENPVFEVHPNPVSDALFINFYSNENTSYHLQLYNALGESIYEEYGKDSALRKKLDVSQLIQGSYILLLHHGDKTFKEKFLIHR